MSNVPENIGSFLSRYIDSIAQLEALLLVRRNPNERWTVASISRRLYVSEADAANVLSFLCHDGLLTLRDGIYSFANRSDGMDVLVDQVGEFYSRHLIAVTNVIHEKPRGLRNFSDAFKLRKERR